MGVVCVQQQYTQQLSVLWHASWSLPDIVDSGGVLEGPQGALQLGDVALDVACGHDAGPVECYLVMCLSVLNSCRVGCQNSSRTFRQKAVSLWASNESQSCLLPETTERLQHTRKQKAKTYATENPQQLDLKMSQASRNGLGTG